MRPIDLHLAFIRFSENGLLRIYQRRILKEINPNKKVADNSATSFFRSGWGANMYWDWNLSFLLYFYINAWITREIEINQYKHNDNLHRGTGLGEGKQMGYWKVVVLYEFVCPWFQRNNGWGKKAFIWRWNAKKLISPLNKRYFHILSLSLECLKWQNKSDMASLARCISQFEHTALLNHHSAT